MLNTISVPVTAGHFFDVSRVHGFIQDKFSMVKNKQTVVTHLSEILKVTNLNMVSDIRKSHLIDPKFSLHNLPSFKMDFCPHKIRKQSRPKTFVHFDIDQFKKLIILHESFDHKV